MKTNVFYHGDCLFVMKHDISVESIDLIYLDPPFFTGQVQKPKSPEKVAEKYDWNPGAMEISYNDSKHFWREKGVHVTAPQWMKEIANKNKEMEAFASYLYYMMERLQECRRVLKSDGSIYLHCDWRASHYLKMVMDEIFGYNNFRNEIVWRYRRWPVPNNNFQKMHDVILRYSKSQKVIWNQLHEPLAESTKQVWGTKKQIAVFDKEGIRHPSQIEEESPGTLISDNWDIGVIAPRSKERTGYPTQKPEILLKRIILASSKPKDIIFDPFCGCGTTIVAAHDLDREWIGIDINNVAVEVIKKRCSQLKIDKPLKPTIIERSNGILDVLKEVTELSPNEFERWVNKFYNATKPSPDKGVDGITSEGVPIQTKTWKAGYEVVSRLLTDAEFHPNVPKPVKKIRIVSREGFDDSARKLAFEIKTKKSIKVELLTPKDMIK